MAVKATDPSKILADYQKEADTIIAQMLAVLGRAHRKLDDDAYRKTLLSLQKKYS